MIPSEVVVALSFLAFIFFAAAICDCFNEPPKKIMAEEIQGVSPDRFPIVWKKWLVEEGDKVSKGDLIGESYVNGDLFLVKSPLDGCIKKKMVQENQKISPVTMLFEMRKDDMVGVDLLDAKIKRKADTDTGVGLLYSKPLNITRGA